MSRGDSPGGQTPTFGLHPPYFIMSTMYNIDIVIQWRLIIRVLHIMMYEKRLVDWYFLCLSLPAKCSLSHYGLN